MKDKYILIHSLSLYRAESRYKKAYGYKAVAQKHADKRNAKDLTQFKKDQAYSKKMSKLYGSKYDANKKFDKIIVMSEREYAQRIEGMGEWKEPLVGGNGKKVWVAFDTPACCDVSTETYWTM